MDCVFLDPTAEPGVPVSPYELSIRLGGTRATVGLVANSFVDSEAFLARLAGRLGALAPELSFRAYDKGGPTHAAEPMGEAEAAAIRNECVAAITAYGH